MPRREPSAAESLSAARVRRFQCDESSDEEGVPSPANNSEPEPEPEPDEAEMLLLALELERVRSQAPDEAVELPQHLDFRVSPPFTVPAGPTSHEALDHAARRWTTRRWTTRRCCARPAPSRARCPPPRTARWIQTDHALPRRAHAAVVGPGTREDGRLDARGD